MRRNWLGGQVTALYPPLRRKHIKKQEPKPFDPKKYDGSIEEGQPLEVTG